MAQLVDAQLPDRVDLPDQLLLDRRQLRRGPRCGFGDEIHGTQIQRLEHVLIAATPADHDHGRRLLGHQDSQEGEAVHARHREIQGDQVQRELEGFLQGLLTVASPAHHLDQRRFLEHSNDRPAAKCRIVDH